MSTIVASEKGLTREQAELELLRARLKEEGEEKLLKKSLVCQQPLRLKCMSCGHKKDVRTRCKKRWCPCCAKQLAAGRADEMEYIVARMRWPLFVTLTMRHDSSISKDEVRTLRRAFGKFRRRKVWSEKVAAGVAAVELVGSSGNWHPHLHCVVDCRWLSLKTSPPRKWMTAEQKQEIFRRASAELGELWAKQLGQPSASVRIKRANKSTIAKEVMKYTVKCQDLVQCTGSAGDIIRSLEGTRAMTTFGEAHGMAVKEIRLAAKKFAKQKRADWLESVEQFNCCPAVDFAPEKMVENERFVVKLQCDRVSKSEPERRKSAIAIAIAAHRARTGTRPNHVQVASVTCSE